MFHNAVNHVLNIRVGARLHVPRECIYAIGNKADRLPTEIVWSHQPITCVIVDVIRRAKHMLKEMLCLLV